MIYGQSGDLYFGREFWLRGQPLVPQDRVVVHGHGQLRAVVLGRPARGRRGLDQRHVERHADRQEALSLGPQLVVRHHLPAAHVHEVGQGVPRAEAPLARVFVQVRVQTTTLFSSERAGVWLWARGAFA